MRLRELLGPDWEWEGDPVTATWRVSHRGGLRFSLPDVAVDLGPATKPIADALLDAVEDHVKGDVWIEVAVRDGHHAVTIKPAPFDWVAARRAALVAP